MDRSPPAESFSGCPIGKGERDITWRNRHAHDKALRELVNRANVG
jgi:hypothetical protein